jgi:hypothetical protein
MPFRHLTKYQLSVRIRAQRAEHLRLAGKPHSLARRQEIRRELTDLLGAQRKLRLAAQAHPGNFPEFASQDARLERTR